MKILCIKWTSGMISRRFLDYVGQREGVRYVSNAEVLTFLPEKTPASPPHSFLRR
jgi:hypothetical protein